MRPRTLGAVCASCAVAASSSLALAQSTSSPSPEVPAASSAVAAGAKASRAERKKAKAERRKARTKRKLMHRNMFLARRLGRVKKDPLSVRQRKRRWRAIKQHSLPELRRSTRRVARKIRRVRERRHGGAPNVPIPGALKAIARCESRGNPRAISPGGRYRGKYQFSYATWRSVGGKGDPARASETEQDRRAAILYRTGGPGHWPVCGR